MPNKSKNIGKAFERECCEKLSNFFQLSFRRIPNSGAFIGGANVYRIATMSSSQVLLSKGDIIPPDELHHLVIECKKRKEINFNQLMDESGNKEINGFIHQTLIDYNACNKQGVWLVLFKSNNRGIYVIYSDPNLKILRNHVCYKYIDETTKEELDCMIHEFNDNWLALNKSYLLEKCGTSTPNTVPPNAPVG